LADRKRRVADAAGIIPVSLSTTGGFATIANLANRACARYQALRPQ